MNQSEAKSAYKLEDQIGFRLRLANQKHLELFGAHMPDVTPTQFAILARLSQDGSLSQNLLGRRVGMDAATTKGVVDRLRSKGWVQSEPSKTDLRRLEISLTPQGTQFAHDAIVRAQIVSEQTTKNLNPRETERLLALLGKL
jgi:DNA-binding MarR family transcriptional regulator